MSYVVFDTKADSIYKDEIENRYHFPARYHAYATSAVGGWVVYREPRAGGGRMAYFAAARLLKVEPDPDQSGHYYAFVDSFTEFDREVSWQSEDLQYREKWLRELPQSEVGVQMRGKSVRQLMRDDFLNIISEGLPSLFQSLVSGQPRPLDGDEFERSTKTALVNRKVRERSFRANVIKAYGGVCAFTGISILDLNGKPEVEAAHIQSVEHGGPDMTSNGLALCRTAHWLFDRYLVSVSDDYKLIIDAENLPSELVKLLVPQTNSIILPNDHRFKPALRFIRFHRRIFDQRRT